MIEDKVVVEGVVVSPENTIVKVESDRAYMFYVEIQARKAEVAKNFLELGRLFKLVKEKKYYKLLEHDTFESFLGSPEISFQRSTVYNLIHIYELYVEKLNISTEFLAMIGHGKLQVIASVVQKDPEDWIYKAKELSKSDLISEVKASRGVPDEIPQPKINAVPGLDFTSYLDFAKAQPCLACGAVEVDPAHFPKTRGAGAPDDWVIPLCRKCHRLQEDGGKDWLWENRANIFGFFIRTFIGFWKGGKNGTTNW